MDLPGEQPRTPAAAGAVLLAAAAGYALSLQGARVPCAVMPACGRTVTFDGGQLIGLAVVGAAALAFAGVVAREGWPDHAAPASGALAAVAAALALFLVRGVAGSALLPVFWPAVAAALLASVLLAAAALTGRRPAAEVG